MTFALYVLGLFAVALLGAAIGMYLFFPEYRETIKKEIAE